MKKTKQEIVEIIEAYITLCTAAVTTDSSNLQKHASNYALYRQNLMSLGGMISIPVWVETSTNLGTLKSNVDLKVEGGNGSWGRRRAYFQSEMNAMVNSYDGNVKNNSMHDGNLINSLPQTIKPLLSSASGNIKPYGSLKNPGNINGNSVIRGNMNNVRKKVFIVHGHDSNLKLEVFAFLSSEGFEPIILHAQTNNGDTIIEKLERYIDKVSFAVVLYTACDIGRANKAPESENKKRARQNVVFEHGYLCSKLGRKNVVALRAQGVEVPGDLNGIVYLEVPGWEYKLSKELDAIR
ncbi:TIR domain-containing protein [Serratia liquefaciens]|uniref:TIR domain-containing protein n=1 Tax=Serratia liquefaciens TaxID=614 RepID=UPI003D05F299